MADKAKDRGRRAIRVDIGGEGPFLLQHLKEERMKKATDVEMVRGGALRELMREGHPANSQSSDSMEVLDQSATGLQQTQ